MRVAVIADIHSNYPALEAVIADIDTQDVDWVGLYQTVCPSGSRPQGAGIDPNGGSVHD